MSPVVIISVVALIISTLTFIAATVGGRRTANVSYVVQLERRVKELEDKVALLEDENLRLMKKLVAS